MAKFYYNGILLPEIPSDVLAEYPYCWIRRNNISGNYDAIFGKDTWYNIYNSGLKCKDDTNTVWYVIEISKSSTETTWYFNKNTTEQFGVDTSRPIIWSNHDIYVASANPPLQYFSATEPVPETPYEIYEIRNTTLTSIADAVRAKTGQTGSIAVTQLASNIRGIQAGGTEEFISLCGGTNTSLTNDSITNLRNYAFYNCTNLTNVSLPECRTIGSYAFYSCKSLRTANFPKCNIISYAAFNGCSSLTTISFPLCTSIYDYAFYYCKSLTTASFPRCSIVSSYAFYECSKLSNTIFPVCITIGGSAFCNCQSLKTISFPECTTISGSYAFSSCANLTEVNLPKCTTVGSYAFYSCSRLSIAEIPNCNKIYTGAFQYCSKLQYANFPNCTSLSGAAFYNCYALSSVNIPLIPTILDNTFVHCSTLKYVTFPNCTSVSNWAFTYCNTLSIVDLPKCTFIGNYAFSSCTSLEVIYLGASTVASLSSTSAFASTPLSLSTYTGNFGSIVVPGSLLSSYQTAANWSVYSNRFTTVYIGNTTYDYMLHNQTVNKSVYMCDSGSNNATYSVTSTDENVATISNVSRNGNVVSFDVNSLNTTGSTTIRVEATCDGHSSSSENTLNVYEVVPVVYEVQDVNGADYGFELNENGYYESQNKGKGGTAALCKLVFTSNIPTIYLDCINSGEDNCDYGFISNLDTVLSTSYSEDNSSLIFKNFKGTNSTSVQTLTITGLPQGEEHFVYIKFRKDGSQNRGNDSLQFKVRY